MSMEMCERLRDLHTAHTNKVSVAAPGLEVGSVFTFNLRGRRRRPTPPPASFLVVVLVVVVFVVVVAVLVEVVALVLVTVVAVVAGPVNGGEV
mmetsp:Transcript_21171/g.68487  ORF Transcript_21171/g.68487 Transcript_21171/m.68487 type:complete len:93 (+) Transcript_21171:330-608(+)